MFLQTFPVQVMPDGHWVLVVQLDPHCGTGDGVGVGVGVAVGVPVAWANVNVSSHETVGAVVGNS